MNIRCVYLLSVLLLLSGCGERGGRVSGDRLADPAAASAAGTAGTAVAETAGAETAGAAGTVGTAWVSVEAGTPGENGPGVSTVAAGAAGTGSPAGVARVAGLGGPAWAAESGGFTGWSGTAGAPDTVFAAMPIPAEVEARMRGVSYPEGATVPLDDLRYLRLSHIDFEGAVRTGEMVCNQAIADDLIDIFRRLYLAAYPIRSIRLVDDFGGSDDASMEADNTSCFNFRKAVGLRRLSRHAEGMAIDINPLENPYVRGQIVRPASAKPYADRGKDFPHKIDRTDLCYKLFREHGFSWGGAWRSARDYQHFEK